MRTQQKKPHVTLALINGQILEYDNANMTDHRPFALNEPEWQYLGEGVIWSVNGVRQAGKERLHFWKRKVELKSVEDA